MYIINSTSQCQSNLYYFSLFMQNKYKFNNNFLLKKIIIYKFVIKNVILVRQHHLIA
jgi:hypothetical protein